MRAPNAAFEISDGQRQMLEVPARSQTAAYRDALRATILLLAGQGVTTTRIAHETGVEPASLTSWRVRLAEKRLPQFGRVRLERGVKSTIPQATVDEMLALTNNSEPDEATHWSYRTMAAKVGVCKDTMKRVWSAQGSKPHLVRTFKLSSDASCHFHPCLKTIVAQVPKGTRCI